MTLTYEQLTKIDILDKFLSNIDENYLKQLTESEQIISILKGTNGESTSVLRQLIDEHQAVCLKVEELQHDFQLLLKVLNHTTMSPDFQSLKYKHGVY
jgi:hypothetical protein